jgi:small subunit ribosomal protein S9
VFETCACLHTMTSSRRQIVAWLRTTAMLGISLTRRAVSCVSRSVPSSSLVRNLLRPLSTARLEESSSASSDEKAVVHAAFTSDMRPPGDTSRKWVKVDELGRAYATGRRKTAVARVWIWPTKEDKLAEVRINRKSLSSFFGGHWVHRHTVLAPFFETATAGRFSVMATVKGGGISGQAEAVRHGIATAMQGLDASLRPVLKSAGFMTRDARVRERKKPGQKGARKKFAWVKR